MELKRVVVTGLGAITPIGNNVQEFWDNLVNGVSGAGPITHFDASLFKTQFACEVKNFNANEYIDRKEARKMDLYTQYAIAVAKQAVTDSGLEVENEDLNRIGVIFGAGIGGIRTFEEEAGNYALTGKENGPKFNPFFIPKMISDIAAGQISDPSGQGQRHRNRWFGSCHCRLRRRRIQRHARTVHPQRLTRNGITSVQRQPRWLRNG